MKATCRIQPGDPIGREKGVPVQISSREAVARREFLVVGSSQVWKEVLGQVERVAPVDTTVLITGESGTGKEVIARLIHEGSPRARRPLVAINCAALPEPLLESELFGHEKGAFTGAGATKIGRVEQAAGATLFLDEVAEMSLKVQAKFLRLLEQREFQRVGGTRTLRADVRILAATNRDLVTSIAQRTLRVDLYYRLNVFGIHIPPLRMRREDIRTLADAFLNELGRTMGRRVTGISPDAYERLLAYSWPGNVRQLRNAIERAVLFCDGDSITCDHLPPEVVRAGTVPPPAADRALRVTPTAHWESVSSEPVERRLVEKALADAMGNKIKAARLLGMTRAQFLTHLARYGLH